MKYVKLKDTADTTLESERRYSDWRPSSIRPPYLVSFICLCLLLSLAIEILLRRSERLGALAFAEPGAELSLGVICLLNYFPTFIGVLFGLYWGLPDHHYKRLEPYFQLSKPGGASAEDSLLLDYAYTNSLLVPYLAFKRSHWPVFFSGAVSIFISFVVIPVMSGVFEQTSLQTSIDASALRATLSSAEVQTKKFSAGFSYWVHDRVWLNGTLPSFTTEEYAILPFLYNSGIDRRNETWVGETILYEADFDCREAGETTTAEWNNISDGKGCMVRAGYGGFWIAGPGMYLGSSKAYNVSDCPKNRTFFTFSGYLPTGELLFVNGTTKLFCDSSYWSQPVRATVQMPAGKIKSIERHGSRTPFNDFNMVSFEGIVSDGTMLPLSINTDQLGNLVNFGYTPHWAPHPGYWIERQFKSDNSGLYTKLLNSISGVVVSMEINKSPTRLVDQIELGKVYAAAYKLLFAFAVSAEMVGEERSSHAITRQFETKAYIANRRWSRFCQAGLGLLITLVISLMISTWGRRCCLDGEPNSIAASLMTISHSHALSCDMDNAEYRDQFELHKLLLQGAHRYELQGSGTASLGPRIDVVEKGDVMELGSRRMLSVPTLISCEDVNLTPYKTKVSWLLGKSVGISLFLYFSGLLAFLVFLYSCDKRYNGLPTVAQQNSFQYKLLFSYLPTIIGMSVAPLWTVLGVYSCMVGPYEALRRGRAHSSSSLTLDYDEMPVHFQLFRSFKARNIVLGALVTAILLANLLAVALGGLFFPISVSKVISADINQPEPLEMAPNTSQFRYKLDFRATWESNEMFNVVAGDIMGYNQLPGWTTSEFYILPFDKAETVNGESVSYQAITRGLGADISCQFMPEDMVSISRREYRQSLVYAVNVNHPCLSANNIYAPSSNLVFESLNPATDFLIPSFECPGTFSVGWIERPANPRPRGVNSTYLDQIDHTILLCNAKLKLAELSVSVSQVDEVLDVKVIRSTNFTYPRSDLNNFKTINYNMTDNSNETNTFLCLDYFSSINPTFDFQFLLGQNINKNFDRGDYGPLYMGYISDLNATYTGPQPLYLINNLMAAREPHIRRQLVNISYLPEESLVIKSFEQVYVSLFAVYLRLQFDKLFDVDKLPSKQESITITQDRVAISPAMFGNTAAILLFFMFVVCFVYSNRPGSHLSHLPTTLASTYALLYASNILDDVSEIRGKDVKERAAKLDKLGNTYSYGFFEGWDQRKHFGVYKELPSGAPIVAKKNT